MSDKKEELEIVGNCPRCGSPIYGHKKVLANVETIETRPSCLCCLTVRKDIRDTMQTK